MDVYLFVYLCVYPALLYLVIQLSIIPSHPKTALSKKTKTHTHTQPTKNTNKTHTHTHTQETHTHTNISCTQSPAPRSPAGRPRPRSPWCPRRRWWPAAWPASPSREARGRLGVPRLRPIREGFSLGTHRKDTSILRRPGLKGSDP